jgi:glycosyltransferase involved in cell wall biosynthesis
MSREATPFSGGAVEETFLRHAKHAAYDFDDALFHDNVGPRRVYRKDKKCERSAGAADVVIAGNDYLATWAEQCNRDVRVIPSCVEPGSYHPKKSWEIHDPPVIVWLGSLSTERYLESIASQLAELHRRTGARLRLISGRRSRQHPELRPFTDRCPWSLEAVPRLLAESDVALAPLDDSPYSRGKCAYKVLQYAATALPIVGSPVGANRIALECSTGIAVETGQSWHDAIAEVLEEPSQKRQNRGYAGLRAVRERYSFAKWRGDWLSAVGLDT